jgi:hypothetical protein
VSSLEDVDGNKGGSGEGETDMDISETSDDERDDVMAVEPDIECGDTHMQVVEGENSEGGREDGEGEDVASDMDTGERKSNKDEEVSESEDAEEVAVPRALRKIPKRKRRTP